MNDPGALAVTLGLTDRVMRAASKEAAFALYRHAITGATARGFGAFDLIGLRALSLFGRLAPRAAVRVVHERVRALSSAMILPAEQSALESHLRRRRGEGLSLNVNVLGEAVLGEEEATHRFEAVVEMMKRPEIDYVSVKLSSVVSQLQSIDHEGSVERVAARLRDLYDVAQREGVFVNLDMEEFRDLRLTLDGFLRVLAEPAYAGLSAGIVLQAYLPESHAALEELIDFARRRVSEGGAPLKVRIVKGANLAMEHAEAELNGWVAAPYGTKADVDASYLALVDRALDPTNATSLRVGVASHNLFHVEFARALARERGTSGQLDIEMLEGMANAEALALVGSGQPVLLYAPVTRREDFAAAVAYLVRRLDENTAPENYLRAAFAIASDEKVFDEQARRFLAAVEARHHVSTSSRRHGAPTSVAGFFNAPNADPTDVRIRDAYAREVALTRLGHDLLIPLQIGAESIESGDVEEGRDPNDGGRVWYRYRVATRSEVDDAVERARVAAKRWHATSPEERTSVLGAVAEGLEESRMALAAVMARDTGKVFHEADTEVSEAVDYARHYAEYVRDDESEGGVVVVVPPWNFPLAIPAGGCFAALAAGRSVIVKPAPEAVAVAHALVEVCWRAGVPRDVLQFVPTRDDEVGRALVTHGDVETVILTGSFDTARLFTSWSPDVNLLAETSGKNSMVIAASADVDAAVKDLVHSAFSHAGQKCSAASVAIVVGTVGEGGAFASQLRDAVQSLVVGSALEPASAVGPVIRPPETNLKRALETLDEGESWLVAPRQLDAEGYLWSPGVKWGVRPGSWSHLNEWFGPVLGVMVAPDLETATRWQNATDFALTAGLCTLDDAEAQWWVDHVEAGNVYLNRGTTGAVVRRQPFGGWKKSSVGPTAKAGGSHYVEALMSFDPVVDVESAVKTLRAWMRVEGGAVGEPVSLTVERNCHRYRPILGGVVVRVDERWTRGHDEYVREIAIVTGARVSISCASPIESLLPVVVETPEEMVSGLAPWAKVRWLSREEAPMLAAVDRGVVLDRRPLTGDGAVEGARWLVEQSLALTDHRYGDVGAAPHPTVSGLGAGLGHGARNG